MKKHLTVFVDTDKVRNYCIRNDLFTKGNCTQYEDMFSYIERFNRTQNPEFITNAARLIVKHSNNENGYSETEYIESVEYDLLGCGRAYLVDVK